MSVFSSPPVTSEVLDATRVWIFVLSVSEQSSKLLFDFGIRRVAYVTSYLTAPLSPSLTRSITQVASLFFNSPSLSFSPSIWPDMPWRTVKQTAQKSDFQLRSTFCCLWTIGLLQRSRVGPGTHFFNIEPSWLFTMSSSSFLGYFFKFNYVHVLSLLRPKQHS